MNQRAFFHCALNWGTLLLLVVGVSGFAAQAKAADKAEISKRIDASANVLNEIMATPDKSIPDKLMQDAKCIAVVPGMLKVAFGIGGSHGKGFATCRTETGWSAPAPIQITGGSWGLQLGGQSVDLVMIVTNDQGMQNLLNDKFKIGANASAAAGPVGRNAGADTDWKMKAEVITYSRAKGIFAGIDLNGSSITQEKGDTRALYGSDVPFSKILGGKETAPQSSHPFLAAVRKYTSEAKEANPAGQ
jgi:lipid-binding SYLF domain-containing protein